MALALVALLAGAVAVGADPVVPLIKSAEIDYSANVLTVLGANFGSSVSSVKFNGLSLVPAYNAAAQKITAPLPSGLRPASYLLTVTLNNGITAAYVSYATPGPQGPQGIKGDTGLTGTQGASGPIGLQGLKGDPGVSGPQGPVGATGLPGEKGNTGLQGVKGDKGDQGIAGIPGPQGEAGPIGPQGLRGDVGAQGETGPLGKPGLQGEKGDKGLNYRGMWDGKTPYEANDVVSSSGSSYVALQANQGAPPEKEAVWEALALRGLDGHQGPQGPQGDFGPIGPQGEIGKPGQQGSEGPIGATGAPGATGLPGPQGSQGAKGLSFRGTWDSLASYSLDDAVTFDGSLWLAMQASAGESPGSGVSWHLLAAKGTDGAQGPKGDKGDLGEQGLQGIAGLDGAQGPQGPAGPQALQGVPGAQGPEGLPGIFPAGVITAFGGNTIPDGWLLCDGREFSPTDYPALAAAIGGAWGRPISGMLNLPDLRGKFMRGVSGVSGVDPDANYPSRFSWWPGGNAGNAVGSFSVGSIRNTQSWNSRRRSSVYHAQIRIGFLGFQYLSFQHDSFHRHSDRLHGR